MCVCMGRKKGNAKMLSSGGGPHTWRGWARQEACRLPGRGGTKDPLQPCRLHSWVLITYMNTARTGESVFSQAEKGVNKR